MRHLDRQILGQRRLIFSVVIVMMFGLLVFGFVRLQVTNKEEYVQQSLNNSIRRIQQYPVRGMILDKDGDILVDNRPSFSAAVIPKVVSDSTLSVICELLEIEPADVQERMLREYGFRPVIVARDISRENVTYLAENRLWLPGVLTVVEPKRFYPDSVSSPHIFGYVGEVTHAEQILSNTYEPGDMVGKAGLEKKYDLALRGSKGVRFVRVDASGRELGMYDVNRNLPPVHGSDLYLSLDYDLQLFAESLFEDKRGALVAIDVRNGSILALVSKPDFDPRLLSGKIESAIWNKLLSDESHPMYSRAIQSGYPPGSTYKIVAAIAALEENIIDPGWEAYCPGYFKLGRKTIRCWNAKGHGSLDLLGAIKNSCNVYFYQLGLKIGLETWSNYSKMLGFGSRTDIDLPNESEGLVPTIEYFNRIYGKNGWTKGNLANLAIGQGELLTTPLQIAQFVMILANKGVYHRPHLVHHIYDYATGKSIQFPVDTRYVTGVSDEVYDIVREGMHQVTNGGTGWLGRVPGIDMAGKTGTAQNPHGDSHAWFMAFAPYEYPEIAISVIVENGGGGGAVAAPLARKFLEMYFFGKLIPRVYPQKDSTSVQEDEIQSPQLDFEAIQPMQVIFPRNNQE